MFLKFCDAAWICYLDFRWKFLMKIVCFQMKIFCHFPAGNCFTLSCVLENISEKLSTNLLSKATKLLLREISLKAAKIIVFASRLSCLVCLHLKWNLQHAKRQKAEGKVTIMKDKSFKFYIWNLFPEVFKEAPLCFGQVCNVNVSPKLLLATFPSHSIIGSIL